MLFLWHLTSTFILGRDCKITVLKSKFSYFYNCVGFCHDVMGLQKKLADIMAASIANRTEHKGRCLLVRDWSQGLVTIKL